jgi:hypothetical protein
LPLRSRRIACPEQSRGAIRRAFFRAGKSNCTSTQRGDPQKLGDALLKTPGTTNPPKQFHARSDALAAVKPALEARLQEIKDYQALSKSTDGTPDARDRLEGGLTRSPRQTIQVMAI